jgi:hypothetical protein
MRRCWPSASASRRVEVAVYRFRSIDEMPPPWREPDDPGNLRAVAQMMALNRRLREPTHRRTPGVTRYASVQEMKASRQDPYHRENPRDTSSRG